MFLLLGTPDVMMLYYSEFWKGLNWCLNLLSWESTDNPNP